LGPRVLALRVELGTADNPDMDKPTRCPDCGSHELVDTTRMTSLYGEIHALMCRACDWSADPRMGRPAADRSKNLGLRRRMETGHDPSERAIVTEAHD
jgi:rubredoxin